MEEILNNIKMRVFFFGFLAGLIPTFLFFIFDDPLSSIWSLFIGLIIGIFTMLVFIMYRKYKILGILLFIILISIYLVYLLILWEIRKGFFGGKFIG